MQMLRNVSVPAPQVAASFATSFTSAQNPLSGAIWQGGASVGLDWIDFLSNGSVACAAGFSADPSPPYNDAVSILRASAFACTPNQYAEITIHVQSGYTPPSTHELGLFVRANVSAHSITGYEAYCGFSAAHTMVRWNGALNDFTPLGGGTPSNPGEDFVHRMEAVGSSIKFYQNGVLISNITDTTFTSGQPGMQSYVVSAGTPANYSVKSFRCGNL